MPQQIVKAQLENKKPPELAIVKEKDPKAADLISRCLEPVETRITLGKSFDCAHVLLTVVN